MIRLIKVLILSIIMILLFHSCNKTKNSNAEISSLDNSINSKVIFSINNINFTNKNFNDFLSVKYKDIDVSNSTNKEMRLSRLFDTFVDNQILLFFANKENINISDDEFNKYIQYRYLSVNDFKKEYIVGILKIDKYLYLKIYKNITVDLKELKNYYRDNPDMFNRKKEIELYQIFLNNRDEAVKIRGELLNFPDKFEKFVKERKELKNGDKSGYMGSFQKGELPKEMEDVVFSLKTNQISRIVDSKYGYHIFKVKKKRNARHESLNNASDSIREILKNKKISKAYSVFMTDLRKKSNIKINYENLYFNYVKIKGDINGIKNSNSSGGNSDSINRKFPEK